MRQKIDEKIKNLPPKSVVPTQKIIRNNLIAVKNVFEKDNNENNEQKTNNKKKSEVAKKIDVIKDENSVNENKIVQNGGNGGGGGVSDCVTPPKPLPRASRTSSLSEDEPVIPKPVARPRTNSVINVVASDVMKNVVPAASEPGPVVQTAYQEKPVASQTVQTQQLVSFTSSKHISGTYKVCKQLLSVMLFVSWLIIFYNLLAQN